MARFQVFETIGLCVLVAVVLSRLFAGCYNYFVHPLSRFPGPKVAVVTAWYKTWQEVFLGRSWVTVLERLHARYGDVIRTGPNELHFARPAAFHDIYNNTNRWDKDHLLYRSFGEDRSSFGFLTYKEAKQRKDVLAPLFSKRAVSELQDLVTENIGRLCSALHAESLAGNSSDLLYGLRCFTADTIMAYCFAQDIDATRAPEFRAPIIVAMDTSLASFTIFRNFEPVRRIVFGMPGWVTKWTTPAMAGLIDLQELLRAQLTRALSDPDTLKASPHPTIYHRLLDPEASKSAPVPTYGSLYEEAQALLFGGADSAGNTTAVGLLHVIKNPDMYAKLKKEIFEIWPRLDSPPPYEQLERLHYLGAVIKESLRIAPGVPAPLLRVVPASGATIGGHDVPPGTVVGMSTFFVHNSAELFPNPDVFDPDRWLQSGSSKLDLWLVAFSKGPRACLGQNLAMCELYIAFAHLLRRFDIRADEAHQTPLQWKETFLPSFTSDHPRAFFTPATH